MIISPKPPTWRDWQARNGGKGWYVRYPLAGEWALEWFVYRLRSLALFGLLDLAGRATVLVAVIFWFLQAGDRAKERHYRAWELINAARGSTGDGGRRDALQDLNKDGVSLAAAPLEQAYLPRVALNGALLGGANLQDANLQGANLQGANLQGANLQGANLWGANLQGANLQGANLEDAHLWGANLQGANLQGANLEDAWLLGANLEDANLQNTHLWYAANLLRGFINLQDANLEDANLHGVTNLQGVILLGANLQGANLQDARGLTQEQLDAAIGDDRTVLPKGLTRPAHWSKAKEGIQPDAAGQAPTASVAPGPDK